MKLLKLSFLLVLFLGLFSSCGDDEDDAVVDCANANATFATAFSEELNNINEVSTEYAMNPTTENCNAFKNAYNDYLDAIEAYEDCAREAGQLAEWNQALAETREALNDIEC